MERELSKYHLSDVAIDLGFGLPSSPMNSTSSVAINGIGEIGAIGVIGGLFDTSAEIINDLHPTRGLGTAGKVVDIGSAIAEQASDGNLTTKDWGEAIGGLAAGAAATAAVSRAIAGMEFGAAAGPIGALVGLGAGFMVGPAGSFLGGYIAEVLDDFFPDTPPDSNTDLMREFNALEERLSTKPNPGTPPSQKTTVADPGGFGLGPGSQFGGNSSGFGSSRGAGRISPDERQEKNDRAVQDRADRIDRADRGRSGSPDDRQERDDRARETDSRSGSPDDRQERNDKAQKAEREKVENTKDKDMDGPSRSTKGDNPDPRGSLGSTAPVLLDLDGNGVAVTSLEHSSRFVDTGGDGLKHHTAWAGAGDGVLFYDADSDGTISQKREYIFTEWDPTASSDMEALRSYFDTNGDGKLTSADSAFANFKILVTNADGSTTTKTLAQLGITEINLTEDATRIVLPDGSVIEGQTTFKKSNGTTGTVASTSLVAETDGHRVTEAVSTDVNGNRVVVNTVYGAGGTILYAVTSVTSPSGASITNSWDDDGDGVTDRIQTIDTVTNGNGSKTETIVNKVGAVMATAIVTSRVVTTRSADGKSVVIDRDSTGGGWFDQHEVQTINTDGSRTNSISDLSQSGAVIRPVSETISIDGKTRTTATDEDGSGTADTTTTHTITVNANNSRTEVVSLTNGDTTLRSSETTSVSADGRSKTITSDLDGDGDTDLTEVQTITVSGSGSTSSITYKNADNSVRASETHTQSVDALTKTIQSDVDGDGDNDTTTIDQTIVNGDLSRVNTVTTTNVDGSVRDKVKVTLAADKVTSETWVDLNQDGTFQSTDLVKSVTVNATTQVRTASTWARNADGTVHATEVVTTSANGLDITKSIDADADGDTDATITDVTTISGGISTQTVTVRNQNNSVRSSSTTTTSADGLTVTTLSDIDGDGTTDSKAVNVRLLNGDGSVTQTSSTYAGDQTTLTAKSITHQSADRRTTTVTTDANGDGANDSVSSSVEAADGSQTITETQYHASGAVKSSSQTSVSANGLTSTTQLDVDGDGVVDTVQTSPRKPHSYAAKFLLYLDDWLLNLRILNIE